MRRAVPFTLVFATCACSPRPPAPNFVNHDESVASEVTPRPSLTARPAGAASAASSEIAAPTSPPAAGVVVVPNVANTVASMGRDFRACFERGLETHPGMKGLVRVSVVIGEHGD